MGCINLRRVDDELHAKAKSKAALEGKSLKEVIETLLQLFVAGEISLNRTKK